MKSSTSCSTRRTDDSWMRFAGFRAPVLLVWGNEDKLFPLQLAQELTREFPDARLVEVPDLPELLDAMGATSIRVEVCGNCSRGLYVAQTGREVNRGVAAPARTPPSCHPEWRRDLDIASVEALTATARAVRQRIRSVLESAIAMNLRNDNPCTTAATPWNWSMFNSVDVALGPPLRVGNASRVSVAERVRRVEELDRPAAERDPAPHRAGPSSA